MPGFISPRASSSSGPPARPCPPPSRSRRARMYARLEQQIAEEPDVVAVTFAGRTPGATSSINRTASVEIQSGAGPAFETGFATSSVGQGFFEAFDRPIVAGRGFHGGDFSPAARTVIVNEAFVRGFAQRGIARRAARRSLI